MGQFLSNHLVSLEVEFLQLASNESEDWRKGYYHGERRVNIKNDLVPHGMGEYMFAERDKIIKIKGSFENGYIKAGQMFVDDHLFYQGEFEDDRPNGQGTFYLDQNKNIHLHGFFKKEMFQPDQIYTVVFPEQHIVIKGTFPSDCLSTIVWDHWWNHITRLINSHIIIREKETFTGSFHIGKDISVDNHPWTVYLIKGKLMMENGNTFEGSFSTNNEPSHGTLTNEAFTYTGTFKNNEKSGQGTIEWKDNSCFKGQFVNNKKHGMGEMKWADNTLFIGQFEDDIMHGRGLFVDYDPNLQIRTKRYGEWKHGKKEGLFVTTVIKELNNQNNPCEQVLTEQSREQSKNQNQQVYKEMFIQDCLAYRIPYSNMYSNIDI